MERPQWQVEACLPGALQDESQVLQVLREACLRGVVALEHLGPLGVHGPRIGHRSLHGLQGHRSLHTHCLGVGETFGQSQSVEPEHQIRDQLEARGVAARTAVQHPGAEHRPER